MKKLFELEGNFNFSFKEFKEIIKIENIKDEDRVIIHAVSSSDKCIDGYTIDALPYLCICTYED